MKQLYAWIVFVYLWCRYFLNRLGIGSRIVVIEHDDICFRTFWQLLRCNSRLRLAGTEHCPRTNPVVFAGNHLLTLDPCVVWLAIYHLTKGTVIPRFMMRDDFFDRFPWTWLPLDGNEICEMSGAIPISRTNPQWSQMKPLMNRLREPNSIAIFPSGTRSRCGMVFEYREADAELGAASFFIAHAQRRSPGLRVAAAPVARTWNPVTLKNAVAFGPPLYLEEGASRDAQRAIDVALAERIADLIEVHAGHAVSAVLYLRCLHGQCDPFPVGSLESAAEAVMADLPGLHVDPAALEDLPGEIRRVLKHLRRRGMVGFRGDLVTPRAEAILSCPPLDGNYVRRNPVKYMTNQIMHLRAVVDRAEEASRF